MSYTVEVPISPTVNWSDGSGHNYTIWAKAHCPSYITNDAYRDDYRMWGYRFYFNDEKDALLFALKWK